MEQDDQKNLILALLLSAVIMFGWFFFFGPDPEEIAAQEDNTVEHAQTGAQTDVEAVSSLLSREEALSSDRVAIETTRVKGSISLLGGRIDDLVLLDYREEDIEDSPFVSLLSPENSNQSYYAQTSLLAAGGDAGTDLPTASTMWSVKSGSTLAPGQNVVLAWRASSGVEFEREFAIDDNYMFTVTDRVINRSGNAVNVQPVAFVSYLGGDTRFDPVPATRGTQSGFILHQGGITNVDGVIEEDDFGDIADGNASTAAPDMRTTTRVVEDHGWTGLTTKYWMTVIAPENGNAFTSVMRYRGASDHYAAEAHFAPVSVAAGETSESTTRIYAGAKEVEVIRGYRDTLDIDRFDDTVDWGWFYFLTKPIFSLLHWLYGLIGNMGFAIIALTFIIKTILFPLAYRSFVSMSKMKKLQPQMEKLKEAAGDDRMKLQQATMELYKKEKVNPVAGCLPILLQIPIFFSLYKVLYVTTELRHADFFGPWTDLSAPDPTSIFNLFGLLPWGAPDPAGFLSLIFIGILALLLGVSMYLTQKLNPTPTEPTQAMIFAWMPWVFMFMMGGFASGLIIYWITNNALTFIQQYTIMRSQGVNPNLIGNITGRNKA